MKRLDDYNRAVEIENVVSGDLKIPTLKLNLRLQNPNSVSCAHGEGVGGGEFAVSEEDASV